MGIPDKAKDEMRGGYTQHNIKIAAEYFRRVVDGTKTFEIRRNDRGYKVGDVVRLLEVTGAGCTLDFVEVEILYITDYEQKPGFVVFSFRVLEICLRVCGGVLSAAELKAVQA